jgi:hypothetical protein
MQQLDTIPFGATAEFLMYFRIGGELASRFLFGLRRFDFIFGILEILPCIFMLFGRELAHNRHNPLLRSIF